MESQTEAMTTEQLRMLEDRKRYERQEVEEEVTKQAPVFTTSLKNIEILEGQRAHFEVRLIPISDPTMKVQWFCNDKPLKSGSRFTEYNDFGFIALDIMYAYAEDSGVYKCVATNAVGQAITSASLVVHTKESILSDTMNQEAMQKIHMLESRQQRAPAVEEATFQAPVFTSPIKDQNLAENMPLHFEARLIPVGDPDLTVEWFRNGVPIQPANRISTMHDFGYVALDMKYVKPEDSGTYTCRATNKLGQAVTSAQLVVVCKYTFYKIFSIGIFYHVRIHFYTSCFSSQLRNPCCSILSTQKHWRNFVTLKTLLDTPRVPLKKPLLTRHQSKSRVHLTELT